MSDSLRRIWPAGADEPPATDDDIAAWYSVEDRSRPWVRVNFVTSLDGSATAGGVSGGLATPPDTRVFDILRRLCDVVVVGAGTVRAEGYGAMVLDDAAVRWRREHALEPQPVFGIVSAALDLDPASPIFTEAPVRPVLITVESAPGSARQALGQVADILICGADRVDTAEMVEQLAERGLPQVHCEGGPHLFGTMVADGIVDELCLTLSPVLEGGYGPRITNGTESVRYGMRLAHVLEADGTLILRYTARGTAS